MLNPYDRPATRRTAETARAKLDNPLGDIIEHESIEASCLAELEAIRKIFLECDEGAYPGPFAIDSRFFMVFCFESFEQREAFRKSMCLSRHGEQYWDGQAVDGTLDFLKKNGVPKTAIGAKRSNPFAARENPFATKAAEKKSDNAERYSDLRAETRKAAQRLATFTEDRTWIAVCFTDDKAVEDFRRKWSLPAGKYVHIEDALVAFSKNGIALDVPAVEFALRAVTRPDKTLSALVD